MGPIGRLDAAVLAQQNGPADKGRPAVKHQVEPEGFEPSCRKQSAQSLYACVR